MRKNLSGQFVGVQMIDASTQAAFTGTVTVYITGDNGTQAIGTTGSGVCTHKGNGYHAYVPTQAETNFDSVAFTFIGSGAKPTTVTEDTTLQTRFDAAPTVAEVATELGLAGDLQDQVTALADAIAAAPTLSEVNAGMFLNDSGQTFADAIPGSLVYELAGEAHITVEDIVAAMFSDNSGQTFSSAVSGSVVRELGGFALTVDDVALQVFATPVDGTTTFVESVRLQNAVASGKTSGAGTGTVIHRDLADTKARLTQTVDGGGNVTGVSHNLS